jgi:tRNA pseudouridine55 synthase
MMGRRGRKKGRPVSGWVILDTPEGMGSTEAVAKVKWLFFADKAGHAGTLDPLASGILPIALGDATKTVPYVMEATKVYRFTVAWGEERTTDDLEGPVTATSSTRPSRKDIEAILPDYIGEISQVPPQFSAIKIAGERAYDLAREGEKVEIAARNVVIDHIELVDIPDEDHAVFEVECGKGTYVRSLARDFGRDLGCYGHVSRLRRLEVAPFSEGESLTIEDLNGAREESELETPGENGERVGSRHTFAALDALLVETGAALDCLPHVALGDEAAMRVRLGNPVIVRGRDAPAEADEAYVTAHGRLVAIGRIEAGLFKPKRVFGN